MQTYSFFDKFVIKDTIQSTIEIKPDILNYNYECTCALHPCKNDETCKKPYIPLVDIDACPIFIELRLFSNGVIRLFYSYEYGDVSDDYCYDLCKININEELKYELHKVPKISEILNAIETKTPIENAHIIVIKINDKEFKFDIPINDVSVKIRVRVHKI